MSQSSSHMFTNATIGTISNASFNIGPSSKQLAHDRLSAAAAHSALHDAYARSDETRCHKNTRVNILGNLERWAQGIFQNEASLFWLDGGVGAGKSAMMQTLSERCAAQKLILGSFFFSRSDPTRNNAMALIPTLAYQVAQLFPEVLQVLHPIIDRDALIFKKSLHVQLIDLLVQPLQRLVQLGKVSDAPKSARVFLIDGLDECDDPKQQQAIISSVAAVCHEYHIPVKFLIASRSESPIKASFRLYTQANYALGSISLSEDLKAKADIRLFIKNEFSKIRSQHPFNDSIPTKWPSAKHINDLVAKSSSHFIYPSTAIKYIWTAKENPVRSLQVVLGLEVSRTLSPFAELDALYRHIFQSAGHLDQVRQILAYCMLSKIPASVSTICIMNEYSMADFFVFMADMTPLVVLSSSKYLASPEKDVKILHVSLGDFLLSRERSGPLYIDKEAYLASKLGRCIQLLDLYSRNQCTEPHWVLSVDDHKSYMLLLCQILDIVTTPGHRVQVAIEEVLQSFSISSLFTCIQRLLKIDPDIFDEFALLILFELHKRTFDSAGLFQSCIEQYFDMLESFLISESAPLACTILPLILLGYPAQALRNIISCHLHGTSCHALLLGNGTGLQIDMMYQFLATADLTSIHHSAVNTSPERLASVAEAILRYLVGRLKRHHSVYSAHILWLIRTKPGKHKATGSPRLASIFHFRRFLSTSLINDPDRIPPVPKRHVLQLRMIYSLLKALLLLLPKAAFSKKLVLYSTRTAFPQRLYRSETGLCRRVQRCLANYNTRVRREQLEKLDRGIENGSIDALIEKSNMLYTNAQD